MKRSWQEKLEPEGLKLIQSYRELNQLYQLEEFRKWEYRGDWESQELTGRPVPSKIELTIHLLDLAAQMPPRWRDRRRYHKLERLPKSGTIRPIVVSKPLFYIAQLLKRMQFGSRLLSRAQKRALAAQCFELCAQICRGKLELPKGRVNLERAELVNFILQFEKDRLTWEELRDAIRHAGGNAPEDPEALRLWVWRGQRERLVVRRKQFRSQARTNNREDSS